MVRFYIPSWQEDLKTFILPLNWLNSVRVTITLINMFDSSKSIALQTPGVWFRFSEGRLEGIYYLIFWLCFGGRLLTFHYAFLIRPIESQISFLLFAIKMFRVFAFLLQIKKKLILLFCLSNSPFNTLF